MGRSKKARTQPCGGPVHRQPAVALCYNTAVIPYAVAPKIRALGMPNAADLRLRASHPCWGRKGLRVEDSQTDTLRTISWQSDCKTMRLVWDGSTGQVVRRQTDNASLNAFPLYESPLIQIPRPPDLLK